MLTSLVYNILSLSANSLVVIPLVLAVRFLLKKQPKGYSYTLWFAVFFSLVFNIKITMPPDSTVPTPLTDIQRQIQQQYTQATYIAGENTVSARGNAILENAQNEIQENTSAPLPETPDNTVSENSGDISADSIFSSYILFVHRTWSIVFLTLIVWLLVTVLRTDEKLNTDLCYKDNIYLTQAFDSPFVFGFIHPKIYIPESLKLKDLSCIITHEQYHIRRKDYIIKPLALLITFCHWFNPLAWLSYHLMCKDMEMSCDEAVIRQLNGSKKEYSSLLLDFATEKSLKTSVTFGESNAESRIKNVLKYQKPAKSTALVLSVIVLSTVLIPLVKTGTADASEDFYTIFDRVSNTRGVLYRYRKAVFQNDNVLYTADGPATDSGFCYYNEDNLGNEHLLPYEKIVGVRVDDRPDGEFFALGFFGDDDNLTLGLHHTLNGETQLLGWYSLRESLHRINKMVSHDYLGNDLMYTAYYTEEYSRKEDTHNIDKLVIRKDYSRKATALEQLQKKLDLFYDGDTGITDVTEYFSLPVSEVGKNVRGVRFFNEYLGFMPYSTQPYEDSFPRAKVTVDGGKTWYDIDFSQLSQPTFFDGYSACCIDLYGDTIEIRVKVRYSDNKTYPYMKGDEPYSLISYDCGKTWAGYGYQLGPNEETGKAERVYFKLTDTVPLTIISEDTQDHFRTMLDKANDMDSTQYRYRMPMDHFGESDWYGLQPGHTWLEGEIFYPESALKNTQPKEAHWGTRGGMGVMINDNPDAPEYSFLYKDGSGQFFIDDYKGENLTDRLTIIIPPNEHITGHDKISDSLYYSQIGGRTYKTENGFTEAIHWSPTQTVYRGIKYLNENVAVKSTRPGVPYHTEPSASITLDGGYTWQRLDFSAVKLPRERFGDNISYNGCIVITYGDIIEIRYHTGQLTEFGYGLTDNYSVISLDGGMIWAGYIRTTGTQQGKTDQPGFHYIKVTETVPVCIKTS